MALKRSFETTTKFKSIICAQNLACIFVVWVAKNIFITLFFAAVRLLPWKTWSDYFCSNTTVFFLIDSFGSKTNCLVWHIFENMCFWHIGNCVVRTFHRDLLLNKRTSTMCIRNLGKKFTRLWWFDFRLKPISSND